MDARAAVDNPLGLNLDFLYGRGYLWAENERISDWATVERLRMEIPDLKFPFDVRGGLARFRDTRCALRELDLRISEPGLMKVLREVCAELDGFSDLDARFTDGGLVVAVRVAGGEGTFITLRLTVTPTHSDAVRLLAHDFRAYGLLPAPARQLVHELLQQVVTSPTLEAVGFGTSFAFDLRHDSVTFRPLKLVLMHAFARRGWKLPNVSDVRMGDLVCRPGSATLRARAAEAADRDVLPTSDVLRAAQSAEDRQQLFARGDSALRAGRVDEARALYEELQDELGAQPVAARLLDVLLVRPSDEAVDRARAICAELEQADGKSFIAAMGRAQIAEVVATPRACADAWSRVSDLLTAADDSLDRNLCDITVAKHLVEFEPRAAVQRLEAARAADPRDRSVLLALKTAYARTEQHADLETVLKQLIGAAPNDETLVDAHVALARHLMESQGQHAEARAFLERAQRLSPDNFKVLDALAEAWVKSGDPASAVKTLGFAATAARQRGDYHTSSQLLFRIGQLWRSPLGNREQALAQVRRALELWEHGQIDDPIGRAAQLRYVAGLCDEDRQHSEAIAYWTEALAALQLAQVRGEVTQRDAVREALAQTHREIAEAYRSRGRHDMAATHERHLIELEPTDLRTLETMEKYHREHGSDGSFVRQLGESIDRVGDHPDSVPLRLRLAERFEEVGQLSESVATLEAALLAVPGAEQVRRKLAATLVEAGDSVRLASLLTQARETAQRRETQWELTVELGDLHLDVLGDAAAAANDYHHATVLLPERREAYVRCRVVFESIAARNGWRSESPLGGTLADDLIDLWRRLASCAPTAQLRADAEFEVDELVGRLGDVKPGLSVTSDSWTRPPSGLTKNELETVEVERTPAPQPSDELSTFRQRYDETLRRPPQLPDLADVAMGSPLARILQKAPSAELDRPAGVPSQSQQPTVEVFRQPAAGADDAASVEELEIAVSDARKAGDDVGLAVVLEELLAVDGLSDARRIDLTFELGELLYYELEDGDRALEWLLAVRKLDPTGYGARPGVLNAIEAIYEERGSTDGQMEILRARLEQAQSDDMRDTYRLLLAQLEWESGGDRDAAAAWLDPVIERDDRHEGARRLLAEIAEEMGEWAAAAEHLKIALSVAGDGLDSVELEKRLANVYLDRLAQPEEALRHLHNVLKAAPSDAKATDSLRRCYAALGDWDAYIASLAGELRMMLGLTLPDELAQADWAELVDVDSVPEPLRIPTSHVLADIARVIQDQQERLKPARDLWRKVAELWPEHLEAVERRIDLDSELDDDDS